jgi:hypothetical protein
MERLMDALLDADAAPKDDDVDEEDEEGREVWWAAAAASPTVDVFLRMTWQRGVVGPTVVARCTDILLAMVPCFPKTVPSALMSKASESHGGWW